MKSNLIKYIFLLLVLFSFKTSMAYDFCVDDIYYNIISNYNMTVEVTYRDLYIGQGWTQNICRYEGDIVIPETVTFDGKTYTVTRIGEEAFSTGGNNEEVNGYFLKSILLPKTIESIGEHAFYNCKALKEIIIPSSITEIENTAFGNCVGLTHVIIPNGVKTLGYGAFQFCENLQEVVISSSVEKIGHNIFYNCGKLKKCVITNNVLKIEDNTDYRRIYTFPQICEIFVPNRDKYITSKEWNDYKTQIKDILDIENNTFTYSGKNPEIDIKCNIDGFQMTTETLTMNSLAGNHIGSISASFLSLKYGIAFSADLEFDYIINKAKLDIKVDNKDRVYGDENPAFTYSSISGFVDGEIESSLDSKIQLSCSATKSSPVGVFYIVPSLNDKNYELNESYGTLSINKAPLSIIINDQSRTYGSNVLSYTLSYSGLKNNETEPLWETAPLFSTEATEKSGVGQYSIMLSSVEAKNYDLVSITPGVLTIIKAPLTIRACRATRKYFEKEPAFSFDCAGFMNDENASILLQQPTLVTDATISSDCGDYSIFASGAEADNYIITYEQGVLSITQRTLNASVGNYERYYFEENPDFKVVYQGFVNSEDESVIQTKAQVFTTADINSNTGTYPITLSGAFAKNYNFQYSSGSLTINPANQTITWDQNLENIPLGTQLELTAIASSGLEVKYISGNESIAPLYKVGDKYYIDCMAVGTVQLRAYQEGNSNFNATERIPKTLSIVDPSGIQNTMSDCNEEKTQLIYNMLGTKVNTEYKGIIISTGKKYILK